MILTQSPGFAVPRAAPVSIFLPMPTIVRRSLENAGADVSRWPAIAERIAEWARLEGIALRDAIVLLPFAQLLPLARDAFARASGWMPRIETTRTLAASLGPANDAPPGQLSFDAALDALNAAALLRSRPWGAEWARRDPRGIEQAAGTLVATAHALARASFALPPSERAAHWGRAREALPPGTGPGATERLLARVALEWASLASTPATDRLYTLAPPSAWIAVQAGGADALAERLMRAAGVPCLVIDTDAPREAPFDAVAAHCTASFQVCDGFEHEAQCAAAQVVAHVRRGQTPVALIAQDRVLVRRIRALLEREGLSLLDETGWKLSTTRAAAEVMALLHAARADAPTDALLDWLKSASAAVSASTAIAALETACRRQGLARASALATASLDAGAARLWAAASLVLRPLSSAKRQPLRAWLDALATALGDCGARQALEGDDAGRQVIAALQLGPGTPGAGAWSLAAGQVTMGFDEFRSWADGVLEQASFVPMADADAAPQVVITPLARAMLRPFAAVVFPGTDDKHLGAPPAPLGLLSDAQAAAIGVPTAAQRQADELLAFAQVLAAPSITLMRRRTDSADPLADSPLVERLALALAAHGRSFAAWQDPRIERELALTPIRMTAPGAAALLPQRLSASACEALRACPYRFFALHLLRLREDEELEREVEKRDYGSWLHEVLFEFHRGREAPASVGDELARLLALAQQSQARQGIVEADFLPYTASFASFAPRYLAWLHERDADGARWLRGEDEVIARPPPMEGTELRGIVDRIDALPGGALQLIDYKTGGLAGLKDKVKQPLEDTQLAFYAALLRTQTEAPLRAIYLALDGTRRLDEVEHDEVEASAAALVDGLAHDLRRLRAGAGLPALGEAATCEHCAARGVCRRDHWAEP